MISVLELIRSETEVSTVLAESGYDELNVNVKGAGEPLLMIHGIIGDGTFFNESGAYLSKNYKVITYDRRGYGKGNYKNYDDFSVRVQAEDAAGILRSTCESPAWVLGNSAGGLIALELAMKYPELVRGMILVEPSLGYNEEEKKKLLAWNKQLNGYIEEGKIKKALPAFSQVIGGSVESQKKNITLQEMQQTYKNLTAFMYGELNEVQHYTPTIEELKEINVPVVIAVTERGRESFFATSSVSAADIIGWPIVHFPGYHNVAQELPFDFACMLDGIIRNIDTYVKKPDIN
jgi:pimeloyl-ACP methyl ester carboxylesterase